MRGSLASFAMLVVWFADPIAVLHADDKPYAPFVAPASDEGQKAIRRFQVPAGIDTRLWAAEPLLANPVAFCFDEKGRCFVAETFRLHAGVTDNRRHMYWLEDDLACRTVADRVKMYRKHAKDKFAAVYETEHDRVKLIWDSKGRGVADQATVFADGFNSAADGLGSGVMARKGYLYFTCIPDLWRLQDTKNQNSANLRESLSTGYGVHVAFLGHDLHGLRMGPDGRLYFSIGDRGLNVTARDGIKRFVPDCGAVLRCEPDGARLEVVHIGLRNPQELAFDAYGNLFTVDNNSDSGDLARLVNIVEGADSGWRVTYQYGSVLGDRGPWNAEKIWHLPHDDQPASILPPLAHISAGPSGFCFNYGATALPAKYVDCFFLCDFRGGSSGSGVWSFRARPKGAGFEIADREQFIWAILATDCEFGPDGGFFVSDWVEGWNCTGKGRIYRFADAREEQSPAISTTRKLIEAGFDHRPMDELARLLEHADQRVRLEAQFALAAMNDAAIPTLAGVLHSSKKQLARLHAIWGLGQIGRRFRETAVKPVIVATGDGDAEVRAQAAKILGDVDGCCAAISAEPLTKLLRDPEPRVRFFAVQSLSKNARDLDEFSHRVTAAELRTVAGDADPIVRHAVAIGLSRLASSTVISPDPKLNHLVKHSQAEKLATLVALGRQKNIGVAMFLDDPDPKLVLEAARVINDAPVPDAYKFLAQMLLRQGLPEAAAWRALNANFRLGGAENAQAVAKFAVRRDVPDKLRVESVRMLGMWANPPQRDRITGLYLPLPARDGKPAVDSLREVFGSLLSASDSLRRETVATATKLGIRDIVPSLRKMLKDEKLDVKVRAEALRGLAALKDAELNSEIEFGLSASAPALRIAAREALADANPDRAVEKLQHALDMGDVTEQQAAYATLARLKHGMVLQILDQKLERLLQGKLPAAVHLDLLDAAAACLTQSVSSGGSVQLAAKIKEKLAALETKRSTTDALAPWRECLVGGDAENGRRIFLYKAETSCVRCHKLNGAGGEVGPELAGIGGKQSREYLLESLVLPDKQIAKGFDSIVLELSSGKTVSGVLRSEDGKEVTLITAEGQTITIPKSRIDIRRRGKSPMPDDLHQKIAKRELRDLVEFLWTLKEESK